MGYQELEDPRQHCGEPEKRSPSVFLCLSGGGFRAALFHYGCLKRLHEVGLLSHVYGMSATSGGALVAALLATAENGYDVDNGTISYDWNRFESELLNLAIKGILGLTALLVFAYFFSFLTLASLVAYSLGWFGSENWGWVVSLFSFAVATLLYIWLLARLVWQRAYAHTHHEQLHAKLHGRLLRNVSRKSVKRFFKMVISPSRLRAETLNLEVFHWKKLDQLSSVLKTYLTAVDLCDGKEKVFSRVAVAALDAYDASELWKDNTYTKSSSKHIEIAEAVAASTSIPPIFRPVHLCMVNDVVGAFVDGGVVDNLAMNIPKAFATQIRKDCDEINLGFGADSPYPTFADQTKLILVMDGSQPLLRQDKKWGWLFPLKRVMDVMTNHHFYDAKVWEKNFSLGLKIPSALVSFRYGVPGIDHTEDMKLSKAIQQIRTHLDAFTEKECAALAYSGYILMDHKLNEQDLKAEDFPEMKRVERVALPQILPEKYGSWYVSPDDLYKHLKHSKWRFSLLRWLLRRFA